MLKNKDRMVQLCKEYQGHKVFGQLSDFSAYYNALSFSTMGFLTHGTKSINLNTYVFSSMRGTLDSIAEILKNGRINDSYALLRKYYDSTIINIYTNLYLDDHFSVDSLIVEKIDNWRRGTDTIPEFRVISKYILDSKKLKPITTLLKKDELYKNVRNRCNDHTHYNYYYNLMLNDGDIYLPNRINELSTFSDDLTAIFVQHFSYLFYLNDHFMMSTDYVDYLDAGLMPEEGSQYLVAPFIQDAFDKWVKPNRLDIANELKSKTEMNLL